MSDAYSWAIRQRVGHGGRKNVLLFMATHATFNSAIADMSASSIADVLEFGESSIRKWLSELEDMGFVEKVPQYRGDGWQLANLYRLKVRGGWVMPEEDEEPKPVVQQKPEPTPKPQVASSRSLESECLAFYLSVRPPNWVEHTRLNGRMKSQIKKLEQEYGERALDAFKNAIRFALKQPFWTNPRNTFSLSNIGSNDKLIEMAEKYQVELDTEKERLFSGAMTRSKAKEIIEKYPDEPITEAMWTTLNQDDKVELMQPGEVRVHQQLGPMIVVDVERNGAVLCCDPGDDGRRLREHVRFFTYKTIPPGEALEMKGNALKLAASLKPLKTIGLDDMLQRLKQPEAS